MAYRLLHRSSLPFPNEGGDFQRTDREKLGLQIRGPAILAGACLVGSVGMAEELVRVGQPQTDGL